MIPNSAWKDYSTNTNYAFDAFGETEEKSKTRGSRQSGSSQQTTLPMSHSPSKTQYYDHRNGNGQGTSSRQNVDQRYAV